MGIAHSDALRDFLWRTQESAEEGWISSGPKRGFVFIMMPLATDPHAYSLLPEAEQVAMTE